MYTIIFLGECLLYAVYHLITFTYINLCCQENYERHQYVGTLFMTLDRLVNYCECILRNKDNFTSVNSLTRHTPHLIFYMEGVLRCFIVEWQIFA